MLTIQQNIPLAPYTTLEIGGPSDYFIEVVTVNELNEALEFAKTKSLPWIIIGGGSNLLISDNGYPGLIIKCNLQGIELNESLITVQSGTPLQQLVDFTIEHELDGLSTLTGIPGTVGGAIYGSAGAYGDNIRDYLTEITYLDNNEIKKLPKDQFESSYRDSYFKHHKNLIILEAKFSHFPKGNKTEMQTECAEILKKRTLKYPPNQKCPGSFFKNVIASELTVDQLKNIPEDKILFGKIPAGYLLETVGAKEMQKGKISVSKNHANTFINNGKGSAKDFYELTCELAKKIYEKYNIKLEPEVQFINLLPFKY